MKRGHLYLPGILTEPDALRAVEQQVALPTLRRLLARAQRSSLKASSDTTFLCEQLGVAAVAPLRAAAEGLDTRTGYWLCADPVHLEMQPSRVQIHPAAASDAEEAQVLCATLNAHFAGDGLCFHAPHPARWYVQCADSQVLYTLSLDEAAWQDAKTLPPQGRAALRWRKVLTEVQMLLHAHPLNQQRVTAGRLSLNSLWLWGGGHICSPQPLIQSVGGDDELLALLAGAADIPLADALERQLAQGEGTMLWLEYGARRAWQRGDLPAWRDALERIEREVAVPLWQALRGGHIAEAWLDFPAPGGGQRFRLTRSGCWKFWCADRPLATHCVE